MDAVVQWIHLLAAAIAVGGAFFQRAVLLPAVKAEIPVEKQDAFATAVTDRFRPFVIAGIGLLILTGFYNIFVGIRGRERVVAYLAVLVLKILLAAALFAVAYGLVTDHPRLARVRENRPRSLAIAVGLGVGVLLLAGTLRRL